MRVPLVPANRTELAVMVEKTGATPKVTALVLKVLAPVKVWVLLSKATLEESEESRIVPAPWPMQPREVAKQPADREKPLLREEVALEVREREPPVMVMPEAEVRPPLVEILMPPVKVEVALLD